MEIASLDVWEKGFYAINSVKVSLDIEISCIRMINVLILFYKIVLSIYKYVYQTVLYTRISTTRETQRSTEKNL